MKPYIIASVFLWTLIGAATVRTQQAPPLAALKRMPVKEITVFKDGHAFVLHEGSMPVDTSGSVQMDYLPEPVLGTFWPYSANKNVRLVSVVAGRRRVAVEETALHLGALLEANTGAEVIITEKSPAPSQPAPRYSGTLLGVPMRSSEEIAGTASPGAAESLPEKGDIILIRTGDGVKVVLIQNIQDVTFKSPYKAKGSNEEFRNLLSLKLDWAGRAPEKTADVGLVYLQKGVRWIPSYKVTVDGSGAATVKLQAMLINELTDFEDVNVNLVIGVPAFAFKDTLDPISLQRTATQLNQYFLAGDRTNMLTNAIATQTARMSERVAEPVDSTSRDLGPEVTDSSKNEDLFVFNVKHVSLRKGERMALPVAEYNLKYKDVYTLDLPFAPPADLRVNVSTEQQAEIARLLSAPKVTHKIRIVNQNNQPLTTAPALIIRGDRVLAQGMMTYTAPGAVTDLEITKAVDIQVTKNESEARRVPNAVKWQDNEYARVDLEGKITLTNYRGAPVDLEITRHVLGVASAADHNGLITKLNLLETGPIEHPVWWNWYSWPSWWNQVNGLSRVTWKLSLEPGKSVELGYQWHYFWR